VNRPAALAVCTTAIGDTLLSIPALDSLGKVYDLDVLVHQHRLPLLLNQPNIRQLYSYRNNPFFRLSLAWRMRGQHYESIVVMHANDDIWRLLPKLDYEAAYNIQSWRNDALRTKSIDLPPTMHVVDKRLLMAKEAGGAPTNQTAPRIYLSEAEVAEAEKWLVDKGLGPDRKRVAIVPGAANLFKRWPARRFGLVARELLLRGVGIYCVGTGSEKELFQEIDAVARTSLPCLVDVPLRRLAAGISRADILLTNDTGPLHLGQTVGTPVLGLFGPTDPATIGPRGDMHRVLKVERTCDPCTTKRCKDPKCMRELKVEQVMELMNEMLANAKD